MRTDYHNYYNGTLYVYDSKSQKVMRQKHA